MGRLFFKKGATLPLTLVGVSQERKLGKQGPCPAFPGRRSARKVASRSPLRPPLEGTSPNGGGETRLCASFMAAHILGSPSGGAGAVRRLRGQPASAPHTSVSPPPSLIPKGGTRLGRGDRKARRKPPWHRRCHQETPGEGFLRKTVHRTIFLFSCAC